MQAVALSFLCGVMLVQWLPALPPAHWVLGGGVLAVGMVWVLRRRGLLHSVFLRRMVWAILAGVIWALGHAAWQLSDRLAPELEGRVMQVQGVVDGLVSERGERLYFPFRVRFLGTEKADLRLRVSWWRPDVVPRAGELWVLPLKLRGTRGLRNPGIFDYEGWLFREGYDGRGFVRRDGTPKRLATASTLELQHWRREIGEAVSDALSQAPLAGLIRALVVGDHQDINRDQWEVLRRTGTGHLVAISGLHVALLSGMVFWLTLRLWGRWGLRYPAPMAASWSALAAALVYAALAGFAVPTQRALMMLVVVLGGVLMQRPTQAGHSLSVALLAVLILDPMAVMAPGFWLSFLAVTAILLSLNGAPRQPFWLHWPRLQLVIAASLFPMSLYWFDQASLVAPLVNLAAVPVVGFVVVPMSLLGTLLLPLGSLGDGVLQGALWVLELLWRPLTWFSERSFSQITLGRDGWGLPLVLCAVGMWLLPRGLVPRWLVLPLLAPLWMGVRDAPPQGAVDMTVLDVGQGQSVLIRTHAHTLVYDAGPRFGSGFDTGSAVVLPYMRHLGIRRLDGLIISHGDNDHAGGAAAILRALPPAKVWMGERLIGVPGEPCVSGESWNWDGVTFRFLGPKPRKARRGNNASCVLRVEAGGRVILLPGDIETSMERSLLKQPQWVGADLLLAPHHGSLSSSTPAFVQATRPQWIIYSTGYRNRFGFPKAQVRERWSRAGAGTWSTGKDGAGRWRIGAQGEISAPWGWERGRRYWHSP